MQESKAHGHAPDLPVSLPVGQLRRADPRSRGEHHRLDRRPEADKVTAALKEKGWRLTHILTTHLTPTTPTATPRSRRRPGAGSSARATRPPKCPASTRGSARATHSRSALTRCRCWRRRPHCRAYQLCHPVSQGGVCRRHAVRHRLRPRHRGHAADDVGLAQEADGAAQGHRGLLRPRVHPGQRQVRPHHRARQRRRCRSAPRRSMRCAPPARPRCRPPSAWSWRPTRSCARTSRRSRSGSGWRAPRSGRSSPRSASARTGAETTVERVSHGCAAGRVLGLRDCNWQLLSAGMSRPPVQIRTTCGRGFRSVAPGLIVHRRALIGRARLGRRRRCSAPKVAMATTKAMNVFMVLLLSGACSHRPAL